MQVYWHIYSHWCFKLFLTWLKNVRPFNLIGMRIKNVWNIHIICVTNGVNFWWFLLLSFGYILPLCLKPGKTDMKHFIERINLVCVSGQILWEGKLIQVSELKLNKLNVRSQCYRCENKALLWLLCAFKGPN